MRRSKSVLAQPSRWIVFAALCVTTTGRAAPPEESRRGVRTFHGPVTGTPYEIHDATRAGKTFRAPDGSTWASAREIDEAERAALPPLRRVLEGGLAELAEDPERRDEPVLVTALFRAQPCQVAGMAARERRDAELHGLQDRRARILDRIAPLRAVRPGGEPPTLLEALEEEARLLTPAEKAELLANRDRVQAILSSLRAEVMAEATAAVDADQAAVRAFVEGLPGATFHSRSVVLSTLTAEVPAGALLRLATEFPEIARVRRTGRSEAVLDTSTATVGAGSWWSSAGTSSSSTKVAVIDTGVDSSHPALSGTVTNAAVFHTTAKTAWDYNDSSTNTDDLQAHGTWVAGVIGSTDSTYRGVAYGGRLMNAKGGYRTSSGGGSGYDSDMCAAGDWAANNGAAVVNYSYGGVSSTTDGSDTMSLFFDAMAYYLSIHVAVAAGNQGTSSSTLTVPADAFNVVTAGGVYDRGTTGTSDDRIYTYSSAGPTSDGRTKPDLVAPGESVTTSAHNWEGSNPDFSTVNGTSFASPHVAGALALLSDFGAASYPEGCRALLLGTARNSSPYDNTPGDLWGYGGLHLGNAYSCRASVREGSVTASGPRSILLKTGSLSAGKRVTLAWNRQVVSNGSSAPTTYSTLLDLDLSVYDAASGASLGTSSSGVDSVEQVAVSSGTSAAVVEIYRYGSFPSGVSTDSWGFATESTGATSVVTGPDLGCSFSSLPSVVGASSEFTVTARLDNTGDLAAVSPAVTLSLPFGYSIVSGTNPRTLSTVAAGGSGSASWTVRSGTGPSGTKTLQASASSSSFGQTFTGDVSSSHDLDADGPAGSVVVNGGASYAASSAVTLTFSASDALSGVADLRWRESAGTWSAWTAWPVPATAFTLVQGDGTHVVEAEFRDGVGNVSSASRSVVVDTTPPSGSVTIAGGATHTRTSDVSLSLTSSDAASYTADMAFSTDGTTWGSWTPFSTSAVILLAPGEGTRSVHARFRDAIGNVSPPASDSITVDGTAPSGTIVVAGGAAWSKSSTVGVALSAEDGGSGVADMRFGTDGVSWGSWQPFGSTATRTLPSGEGTRTVHAQFRDLAGNVSVGVQDSIGVDLTRPTVWFTLNADAAYVLPWQTLRIDASLTDAGGSGVAEFRSSLDGGFVWSPWTSVGDGRPEIPVPPGLDDRSLGLRCEFRDAAGNVSVASEDLIHVVAAAPQLAASRGSLSGQLASGGDVDTYRIDLVAGQSLDVGLTAKAAVRSADQAVVTELWGPDGAVVLLPPGTRKTPIRKFAAPVTGTYWLVLRATGADAAVGTSYKLQVRTASPKALLHLAGTAVAADGEPEGTVSIEFPAAPGWTVSGTLRGAAEGTASLASPGGTRIDVLLPRPRRGTVRLAATALPEGVGTFRLTLPSAVPVLCKLTLRPPGSARAVELP